MKPFSVITWRLVFIFFFLTSLSASPAQHVSAIQPNPFLVADLNTTPQHSYPYPFMPDGAVSYFFTYNYGQQLWIDKAPRLYQTDGTQAGTHIVKSIGPGDDSADTPQSMKYAKFGDYLFFSAYNGDHQAYEVWRTDGTTENTIAVPISSTDGGSLASFLLLTANRHCRQKHLVS
jgi:ELWxxDGT repeat protein